MKITTLAPGEQFELPQGQQIITQHFTPVCGHAEARFATAIRAKGLRPLHDVEVGALIDVGGTTRAVRLAVARAIYKKFGHGEPNAIIDDPDSPFHMWIINAQQHIQGPKSVQDWVLGRPLNLDPKKARNFIASLKADPWKIQNTSPEDPAGQSIYKYRQWINGAGTYRNKLHQERLAIAARARQSAKSIA